MKNLDLLRIGQKIEDSHGIHGRTRKKEVIMRIL
jgi:hypothetical protein